jgi:hypothetical protein
MHKYNKINTSFVTFSQFNLNMTGGGDILMWFYW